MACVQVSLSTARSIELLRSLSQGECQTMSPLSDTVAEAIASSRQFGIACEYEESRRVTGSRRRTASSRTPVSTLDRSAQDSLATSQPDLTEEPPHHAHHVNSGLLLAPELADVTGADAINFSADVLPDLFVEPEPERSEPISCRILGPTSLSFFLNGLHTDPGGVRGHDRVYGLDRTRNDYVRSELFISPPMAMQDEMSNRLLTKDVVQQLLDQYRRHVWPLIGIMPSSRSIEVADYSQPLVLAMCGIAALSRNVPRDIFCSIRSQLRGALDASTMRISSVKNVQTMLIMCMSAELHGVSTAESGSSAWLVSAAAIRQAQDLGMHRNSAGQSCSLQEQKQRMYLWMACVITDRWYSHTYGQPPMIDMSYCDEPIVSESENTEDQFQAHMYSLSILLSAISFAIYRPCRLAETTDAQLAVLTSRIDHLIVDVGHDFEFHGPSTAIHAGVLNMVICCVEIMLFRTFVMRNSFEIDHLAYRVRPARWFAVRQRADSVVDWAAGAAGAQVMDHWFIGMYCLAQAALLQYHTAIMDSSMEALERLGKAYMTYVRWSDCARLDGDSAIRAKVADIIRLLYASAERHLHAQSQNDGIDLSRNLAGSTTSQDNSSESVWNNLESIDWTQFLGADLAGLADVGFPL